MNSRYTKNEFYDEIKRLYCKYGKINKNIFNKYSKLKINFQSYCLKYGGIKNICKELNLKYNGYVKINRNDIINKAKNILNKYNKINKELCIKNGISSSVVRREFGNFTNLFKEINYNNNFNRNVELQCVLEDIKHIVNKYNTTSSTTYRNKGKYSQSIIDRFGGWIYLIEKLGYKPKNKKIGLEAIKIEVENVLNEYGFISKELINNNCTFTYQALSLYFKDKKELSNYFGYDNIFNYGRSYKEKLISNILNNLIGKDKYFTEYSWNWLLNKNGKRMYVDFFIPDNNLVIEYDGEQHFRFVSKFHKTIEDFENQVKRDKLKNKLIKEHNINIIRINYKDKITTDYIYNLL